MSTATATTKISMGINLDSSHAVLQGAGDTAAIDLSSIYNNKNGSDAIIYPNANNGLKFVTLVVVRCSAGSSLV